MYAEMVGSSGMDSQGKALLKEFLGNACPK